MTFKRTWINNLRGHELVLTHIDDIEVGFYPRSHVVDVAGWLFSRPCKIGRIKQEPPMIERVNCLEKGQDYSGGDEL
jgi:hypothetical protein